MQISWAARTIKSYLRHKWSFLSLMWLRRFFQHEQFILRDKTQFWTCGTLFPRFSTPSLYRCALPLLHIFIDWSQLPFGLCKFVTRRLPRFPSDCAQSKCRECVPALLECTPSFCLSSPHKLACRNILLPPSTSPLTVGSVGTVVKMAVLSNSLGQMILSRAVEVQWEQCNSPALLLKQTYKVLTSPTILDIDSCKKQFCLDLDQPLGAHARIKCRNLSQLHQQWQISRFSWCIMLREPAGSKSGKVNMSWHVDLAHPPVPQTRGLVTNTQANSFDFIFKSGQFYSVYTGCSPIN